MDSPRITQSLLGVRPSHGIMVTLASLDREPLHGDGSLLLGQPLGALGVVGQEEENEEGREARGGALDDEQPPPGGQAARLVHVAHTIRDGAAKGASESGRCQNEGDADASFLSLVPECQVVDLECGSSCQCGPGSRL